MPNTNQDDLSFLVSMNGEASMAKNTPSMAKNQMRRSLNAILDPHPSATDVLQLWAFFDSACAYCGAKLVRSDRSGHLDHILPHSAGGTNDIHNHVLACARCNGDEKREEDWRSFLERKVELAEIREERSTRIRNWMQLAPANRLTLSSQERQAVDSIVTRALQSFDTAVDELRAMRRSRKDAP